MPLKYAVSLANSKMQNITELIVLTTLLNFPYSGLQPRIFENRQIKFLNCTHCILEADLPLQKIEIPHLIIDLKKFNIPAVFGFIILNNTVISGLTDLYLTDVHLDLVPIDGFGIEIKLKLNSPLLKIKANYDADFVVNTYEIFGLGNIEWSMENFILSLTFKVALSKLHLEKIHLNPTVEHIKLDITGFLYDDEQSALLSQLVDEEGVSWVNGKSEDIADIIEELIKNLLNSRILPNDARFPGLNAILEVKNAPYFQTNAEY